MTLTYTKEDLNNAKLAHSDANRVFERAVATAQLAEQKAKEAMQESAKAMQLVDEIEAALQA
jgi:hypothetical protein